MTSVMGRKSRSWEFNLPVLTLLVFFATGCYAKGNPHIAVVGGGVGGATTVHFLEEFFGPYNARIDLFEPHNIGGRLATLKVDGNEFEVGGSIIHSRNRHMKEFMKLLGLKEKELESSKFALFDGEKITFAEDSSWNLLNTIKLLYRYGMGPFYLNRFIEDMLAKFDRIYHSQENGNHYLSVDDILNSMSPEFVGYLHQSAHDGFKRDGLNELLIEELIGTILKVNYGQTLDVHKFVASVSTSSAVGDLFAVEGGNRRVPEGLLEKSNANIIKARVTNITLLEAGDFLVHYEDGFSMVNSSLYDIVILAVPLAENIDSGLQFSNFPEKFVFPGKYHQTVSTLVVGTLNYTYFGLHEGITEIFTLNKELFFRSIGRISPVDGERSKTKPNVWKIFSDEPLSKEELNILFSSRKDSKTKKWLAYPHYMTQSRADGFVLYPKLYFVNAIEWAASAMEMSAIGGKNVAILAFKDWTGQTPQKEFVAVKEEL